MSMQEAMRELIEAATEVLRTWEILHWTRGSVDVGQSDCAARPAREKCKNAIAAAEKAMELPEDVDIAASFSSIKAWYAGRTTFIGDDYSYGSCILRDAIALIEHAYGSGLWTPEMVKKARRGTCPKCGRVGMKTVIHDNGPRVQCPNEDCSEWWTREEETVKRLIAITDSNGVRHEVNP